MENLTVGVILMAVILLVVVIYLSIQWIDKLEFKYSLDYLENDIEELEERIDKNWTQEISDFNSLNKRIEKLEKETKVSTVDRKDIFSNEYYERANIQALETAKYAEFLARESIKEEAAKELEDAPYQITVAYLRDQDNKRIKREYKEMIEHLKAIPYEFRTDTQNKQIRAMHLLDPRNNINNKTK